MKEKEFTKKLEELNFTQGLIINPFYALDKKGNVVLDVESMEEELQIKIKELQEVLK